MPTPEPEITETIRKGVRKWWRAETYATPKLIVVTVQHQPRHPDPALRGKYETAITRVIKETGGRGPVDWSSSVIADDEDAAMVIHAAMVEDALAHQDAPEGDQ